ncbi:hypothetical protein RhiirA4_473732 [Rhizophagus irregularis]|uniref:Uncharacterized protein n=1 Tax=Rhizophagus irregularis TaxID=588596 RepID=A0A2I1H7A3_9GLOM|nr:hypothetical protein RhiirA4_473732 [Rhizophagus irregularis]
MSVVETSGIACLWKEISERESQFCLIYITKEIHSIEYPNYKYSPVRSHDQNKNSSEIESNTTSEIDISPETDINMSEIDNDMVADLFQSDFMDVDPIDPSLFINQSLIDSSFSFIDPSLIDYSLEFTHDNYTLQYSKEQLLHLPTAVKHLKQLDFCSVFRCPFVAGNFNETVLNILPSGPKDPVNTNFIFDTKRVKEN